ncbi:D-glycero-alpha-D-manno-heptose-1,7-bisphosphate 7-phosphatase [Nanoarchaeota archaeon]
MEKAIFLDRDGVLNEDREGYPHKSEHLILAKNSIEGMKLLSEMDFKRILVTNQSGVGVGKFAKEDFYSFNEALFSQVGNVHDVFVCFHHKEEGCECRKPSAKMLEDAAEKHDIDLSKSFVIGDQDRDIEMGINAGCRTIFIKSGAYGSHKSNGEKANFIAKDLLDAVEWIKQNEN